MDDLEKRINELQKIASQEIYLKEDYDSAITIINELISLRTDGRDYEAIAYCYQNLGRNDDALRAYKMAVRLNPSFANSWANMGVLLSMNEKYAEAVEPLKKALELNPQDPQNLLNLTTVLIRSESKESLSYIERCLHIYPNNEKLWNNLGEELRKLGRDDEAINAYTNSINLNPKEDAGWFNLAVLFYSRNRFEEALQYIDKAFDHVVEKDGFLVLKSSIQATIKNDWQGALQTANLIKSRFARKTAFAVMYTGTNKTITGLECSLDALTEKNVDLSEHMSLGILSLLKTNISLSIQKHVKKSGVKDLIDILRENFNEKLSKHSGYILSALFDAIEDNIEYNKLSIDLFKDILRNTPEALQSLNYNSKNTLKIISKNIISQNIYIIKATGKENSTDTSNIEKEYRITRFVNSISPKTSKAIFLEQGYMLEKKINKPSLEILIGYSEKEELEEELTQCIDTLSEIHYKIRPKKISDDYFEMHYYDKTEEKEQKIILQKYSIIGELDRRFAGTFGGDATKVIKEFSEILEPLILTEQFIHADTFKGNWLSGGTIIDWDRASIGDPMIDLVQLINDVDFRMLNREALAEQYMKKVGLDHGRAMRKYEVLCIHDSLCNIGTSYRKDVTKVQGYYEQTMNQTQKYPQLQRAINNYLISVGMLR